MTSAKTTKRALLSSIMALFICFAMLLGTTYAWFTDSVTSANNIIQSGNLHIILEYYDTESQEWKDVKDSDDILTGDLWEPGYVDVAYLRIKNNGSLALKYALSVNIISETEGINSKGDKFLLSDYIYFDVVNDKQPTFENRDAAMATVDSATKISSGYSESGSLAVGSDFVYLAMVVYMPTTVDNVANHNGVDIPQIDLGINIFATQDTVEPDSFGPDYDKDNAVYTVAEANAWLAQNKDVTLVGCNEPDGILYIPADYTGTLTIANAKIKSVQAAGNANIVIWGSVVVNANGSGAATVDGEGFDGSAITANGELKISGTGKLTAIAADVVGAFGIGGIKTTKLTIENVHILEAKGSFAQPGITSDYGKKDPEGGAAIGSGYSGAVITLNNVIVDNAQGGSKAAAIGARYWTGVTININNSIIKNAIGGSNSAGIGGSRVSSGATSAESITINIVKSNVTAIGGDYGAGIGSGYSTYLVPESDSRPVYTINIDEASVIKATGGVAAAGIGTGHNVVGLAGEIKSANVTATAGQATCPAPNFNCCYGRVRSDAQDIGFGSLADEIIFKPITQTITYLGEKIAVPVVATAVTTPEAFVNALAAGEKIILSNNITLNEKLIVGIPVDIDLNGQDLATVGFELQQGGSIKNGNIKSAEDINTEDGNWVFHFLVSGGTLTMDDVNVAITDSFVADTGYNGSSQACGIRVENAKVILNDCNVKVHNDTNNVYFVQSWAVDLLDSEFTMNGGSIVAMCDKGTAKDDPGLDDPAFACAISADGICTVTLNGVEVEATYFGEVFDWQDYSSNLTFNTTDTNVTEDDFILWWSAELTVNHIN